VVNKPCIIICSKLHPHTHTPFLSSWFQFHNNVQRKEVVNKIGVRAVLVLEIELNHLFRSNSRSLFAWMFCPTYQTLEHQIETKILFFQTDYIIRVLKMWNGICNPFHQFACPFLSNVFLDPFHMFVKRNRYSVSYLDFVCWCVYCVIGEILMWMNVYCVIGEFSNVNHAMNIMMQLVFNFWYVLHSLVFCDTCCILYAFMWLPWMGYLRIKISFLIIVHYGRSSF